MNAPPINILAPSVGPSPDNPTNAPHKIINPPITAWALGPTVTIGGAVFSDVAIEVISPELSCCEVTPVSLPIR
jgi:hypothetical protein